MPRREYFENNPIQKDDTAQSANAYMSLSGRNRRFSKHEIKTFFTSSIVFLNLWRKWFFQLRCHKVQERLTVLIFLRLPQRKNIVAPIFFKDFRRKKMMAELDIVHQQTSRSPIAIYPRMNGYQIEMSIETQFISFPKCFHILLLFSQYRTKFFYFSGNFRIAHIRTPAHPSSNAAQTKIHL